MAYGIDHALPALQDGDARPLVLASGAYLVAALLGGVLVAATVRASARVSQTMLLDLRRRVFRHTQRLSLEFHEQYTSGRIISRQTSDVEALRELLDGGVTTLATGVLAMVLTAASLVLLDWRSGLVLLVAVVPGVLLTRWFQVRSQLQYRRSRTAVARLIVRFVETMTGIRAVQAFRREREVEGVYGELAETYRGTTAQAIRLNGVFDTGLVLIGNVTVAAVLLVGGLRALDGGLEVGVLVASVLYARRFFFPLAQIGMFYNSFQSATAALEKLAGLLAEEPSVPEPDRPVRLTARLAATSASRRSSSGTAPDRPCSPSSTSTSRPGSRSPWWGRRARASPPWPSCSPGSTTSAAARSGSTAWTCARSTRPTCAVPW